MSVQALVGPCGVRMPEYLTQVLAAASHEAPPRDGSQEEAPMKKTFNEIADEAFAEGAREANEPIYADHPDHDDEDALIAVFDAVLRERRGP